jgi:transposase-like protein
MNKFPLRRCADVCKINLKTAFIWRHKILDALQNMHNEVVINGVAEADETYFRVSYKGNHKKSAFQMPRKSRKRGGESSKRGISSEQACVLCSVNLDGLSIGMLSNLGRPFVMDLEAVFSQRIERGSILVTDSFRGYSKLAYENGLTHIAIPRGKHTNGAFNIQTVNAYHKDMKKLIQFQFSGVSTKYLNNYVVYHNFVNFAKGSFSEKLDILKEFVFTTRLTDRYQTIQTREPVPVLRAA